MNLLLFFQRKSKADNIALTIGKFCLVAAVLYGLRVMVITQLQETGTQTEVRRKEDEEEENKALRFRAHRRGVDSLKRTQYWKNIIKAGERKVVRMARVKREYQLEIAK